MTTLSEERKPMEKVPASRTSNFSGPGLTRRKFIGALGALAVANFAVADENPGSIELFAFGDWGAPPATPHPPDAAQLQKSQKRVAQAMAEYARELSVQGRPLTAVFGLGDNMYDKLTGPDDLRFVNRFENLYPKPDLNVPFYVALGNHEYEDYQSKNWLHEIAYARQNPGSRWKWPAADNATWYRQDFPRQNPLVSVVVLDTNTDHVKGKWNGQIDFLRHELAAAQSSHWRIVVAHHPMWTDGHHCWDGSGPGTPDADLYPTIHKTILPELSNVVFYVSGHDHNLQHIRHTKYPGTNFLLSGAGGGAFPEKRRRPTPNEYTNEFFETTGFLHLSFTVQEARAQLIAVTSDGWKPVGTGAVRKAQA